MRSCGVGIWLLMSLVGCSWSGERTPSVLVIAVENLGFNQVPCESEQLKSSKDFDGFLTLCEESVRFTHAFTTSPLSQAGMGSLLTGLYPFESGLRHNGNLYLPASVMTAAESAVENGMRTAFFSGGPPILRKSGLSQGFEVFDDNFRASSGKGYRAAPETFEGFLNWLDREASRQPFFAVAYLPDLQFPEIATTSELGEVRDRSFDSQMREVSESIGVLIRALKTRKVWSQTNVILVGLNGNPAAARAGEFAPLDLFAEATQVALLIKPAQKERDRGIEWKIDRNVSLVDVGSTLFELVGGPTPKSSGDQSLERVSLTGVLKSPEADWNEDRLILLESAWASWRNLGDVRLAARRNQYFYIHDRVPKVFNSLIDRLETVSLPAQDPLWHSLDQEVVSFFVERNWEKWASPSRTDFERLQSAQRLWVGRPDEAETLLNLARTNALDEQRMSWVEGIAARRRDWALLADLTEKKPQSLAHFVARRNLGHPAVVPVGPCAALFRKNFPKSTKVKDCSDDLLLRAFRWANEASDERKLRAQEVFLDLYSNLRLESRLGELNYAHFLTWDVPIEWPVGLSLADLYLANPEYANLAEILQNKNLREDQAVDL